MAIRHLSGVPFPSSHDDFKNDERLRTKIRRLSDLIEIRNDFTVILETYKVLEDTISKKLVLNAQFPEYGVHIEDISEMIFTHLLVIYAKSFTSSTGATNLNSKKSEIFPDVEPHEHFMELRNQFYGHREMTGNAKQVRLWPNSPEAGQVAIDIENLFTRWQVAQSESTRLGEFNICAQHVANHLDKEISSLKKAAELSFSQSQRDYVCRESRESIENEYGKAHLYFEPKRKRKKVSDDK